MGSLELSWVPVHQHLRMALVTKIDKLERKIQELCQSSLKARNHSYSPYSKFKVGATLLCPDGSMVSGCNVENASYGLAICAERTAVVKVRSCCPSTRGSPLS